MLAFAVMVAIGGVGEFAEPIPYSELTDMISRAQEAAPAGDLRAEGYLAGARAWLPRADGRPVDAGAASTAVSAARRCGEATLESAAIQAAIASAGSAGRHREAYALWRERADLLARLPRHLPSSAPQIWDIVEEEADLALAAGDPARALMAAQAAWEDDVFGGVAFNLRKLILPLVLTGRFDDAIEYGKKMWVGWQRAGKPVAAAVGHAAYSVAMAHALRGDAATAERWRTRGGQAMGAWHRQRPYARSVIAFFDARMALHMGHWNALDRLTSGIDETPVVLRPYALSAAAELAVAAGRSGDIDFPLIDAARTAARENDWAIACLARIEGRRGDPAALDTAVELWERIGARFERACTLHLIPDRRAEALAEFAVMGVDPPVDATADEPQSGMVSDVGPAPV